MRTGLAWRDLIDSLSREVMSITGVQLGDRQRAMVESRLRKRMQDLELEDELQYSRYVDAHLDSELAVLVSLLTTHHTYFFREFAHFEHLRDVGMKKLIGEVRKRGDGTIRVWCAACSRGQEVYSLAMFFSDYLKSAAPDLKFEIWGTDIDPESVSYAENGVYPIREVETIPAQYREGHWVKGSGDIAAFAKARETLRKYCRFSVMNLLESAKKIPAAQRFDLIFCRNVFIYFAPDQIRAVSKRFLEHLQPHGTLFLGISETLNGHSLPVKTVGPSVYIHVDRVEETPARLSVSPPMARRPLRVLCVDDSPSILSLLKQVLSQQEGFEVVAIAKDGLEASAQISKQKFDVMTLDLHMAGQDGLSFLKSSDPGRRPPVVVISSVSREESDLVLRCFEAGAADYVEKPSLATLSQRGEEIRAKLRVAEHARVSPPSALALEKALSGGRRLEPEVSNGLRIVVASLGDRERLKAFQAYLPFNRAGCIFLVEGAGTSLASVAKLIAGDWSMPVQAFTPETNGLPNTGQVFIGEFETAWSSVLKQISNRKVSICVLGGPSSRTAQCLVQASAQTQVLWEEQEGKKSPGKSVDWVPFTSFVSLSTRYLKASK